MIAALDTAGPWVCVAAGDSGAVRAQLRCEALANHNELVPLAWARLLEALSDPPSALAVDVGPGSFTGTRVGVSFMAGLGQALGLSVLPVSSFVLAASLAAPSDRVAKVVIPLVRGVVGVCDLEKCNGLWQEQAWQEKSVEELKRSRGDHPLICPWGGHPVDVKAPPDWNPAAELVRLATLSPADAFESPHRLSVRYMGKCQAERTFDARRAT